MNKNRWWEAAFIVVGVLLGTGIIFLVSRPPRGKPIELIPVPTPAPIMVYVQGGVNQPGLYSLPQQSRVNDAILAAGGLSEQADVSSLNLAKILQDGDRVDIATISKPVVNDPETGLPPTSPTQRTSSSLIVVNINSATLNELDTLPEIGPITAQSIIDYRNTHGPFTKIDDILYVNGIGPATFEKIRELITVDTSP